ncbi:MAG: hypothetical protein ACTSU7_00055 [Candidatus Heimdallarchaeaceae archaeon]
MMDLKKWKEIKQTEYKKLKKQDPENVNGYTCRICFKYYKRIYTLKDKLGYDARHSGNYWFEDVQDFIKTIKIEVVKTHHSNMTWTQGMNNILKKIDELYGEHLEIDELLKKTEKRTDG